MSKTKRICLIPDSWNNGMTNWRQIKRPNLVCEYPTLPNHIKLHGCAETYHPSLLMVYVVFLRTVSATKCSTRSFCRNCPATRCCCSRMPMVSSASWQGTPTWRGNQANDSRRYPLRKTVHKGLLLKTTVTAYRHTDVQPDVENLKQCICRQGAPEGSEVPPTLLS